MMKPPIVSKSVGKIKTTRNRYGWTKVETETKEHGKLTFNVRTKTLEKWRNQSGKIYDRDMAHKIIHKWEKNTVQGHIFASKNAIQGWIKALNGNGMTLVAEELTNRLAQAGNNTERLDRLREWCYNNIPELSDDEFYDYPKYEPEVETVVDE